MSKDRRMQTTTLKDLSTSASNDMFPPLDASYTPVKPGPINIRSTITGIYDLLGALGRSKIGTSATQRYWYRVSDTDVLMPAHLDLPAALGCVLIVLVVAVAVFK